MVDLFLMEVIVQHIYF